MSTNPKQGEFKLFAKVILCKILLKYFTFFSLLILISEEPVKEAAFTMENLDTGMLYCKLSKRYRRPIGMYKDGNSEIGAHIRKNSVQGDGRG